MSLGGVHAANCMMSQHQKRIEDAMARVPSEDVLRLALERAAATLREVMAASSLSPRLREHARIAADTLQAIHDGTVDELRRETLATLQKAVHPAAFERLDWPGRSPDRPAGRDGWMHEVRTGGTSTCGLPPEALEVIRAQFISGRMDSCPICSSGR